MPSTLGDNRSEGIVKDNKSLIASRNKLLEHKGDILTEHISGMSTKLIEGKVL